MPHSVSSNDSPKRVGEDDILPDAPPIESANPAVQEEMGTGGTENVKAGVKLEDMFNDDEDDEFPASSAADAKTESSPPPGAAL